jgi:hypothetical protein
MEGNTLDPGRLALKLGVHLERGLSIRRRRHADLLVVFVLNDTQSITSPASPSLLSLFFDHNEALTTFLPLLCLSASLSVRVSFAGRNKETRDKLHFRNRARY